MRSINNVGIGIMMKVNELASRYGIEVCDFVAAYKDETTVSRSLDDHPEPTGRSILSYEIVPQNPSKLERFELMLESLGASNETGLLIATDEELVRALNKAIAVAPRSRSVS